HVSPPEWCHVARCCSPTVTEATTGPPVNGCQRRRSTVNGGGPPLTFAGPPVNRWSTTAGPPVNSWSTTVGPPPDHQSTASQRSGQPVATAATWHASSACGSYVSLRGTATSADWVLLAYVADTSAADVA
ncbi:hypothetical protein Tco_0074650, partial [Tanacetum coccineum]